MSTTTDSQSGTVALSADLKVLLHELQNEIRLERPSDHSDAVAAVVLQYCENMQRQSVTRLSQVAALTRDDLVELGVSIGHRQWIIRVATRLVLKEENSIPSSNNPQLLSDTVQGIPGSPLSPDSPSSFFSSSGVSRETMWLNLTGKMTSMAVYMDEMRRMRIQYGFPKTFDRMFLHNQPMPFFLCGGAQADDTDVIGILLRVPDLTDTTGTTVNTITNRVCLLVNRTTGVVITYHRCSAALLSGVEDDVRAATHGDGHVVLDCLVDAIIRRLIRLYHAALEQLQEQVDYLETQSEDGQFVHRNIRDTQRVQRLAFLAKRATVYKRCADASRDVLQELEEIPWVASHIPALVSGLDAVSAMAEELSSNAHVSIDVIIALSEFKASNNLKAFTYLTVFFYPISVATSWYGMNYPMPELVTPNAYYIFAGTTLSLTTLFFCWFVGLSTDAWRWFSWCCCLVMRRQQKQRDPDDGDDIGGSTTPDEDQERAQSLTAPLVDRAPLASSLSQPRMLNDGGATEKPGAKPIAAAQTKSPSRWESQRLTFSDHLRHSSSMVYGKRSTIATSAAGAAVAERTNPRSAQQQQAPGSQATVQPTYGTITA